MKLSRHHGSKKALDKQKHIAALIQGYHQCRGILQVCIQDIEDKVHLMGIE